MHTRRSPRRSWRRPRTSSASPVVAESIRVVVAPGAVTALRYPATEPAAPLTLVLGHGAGAPQTSALMVVLAPALARRGSPNEMFNFPYMEQGRGLAERSRTLE